MSHNQWYVRIAGEVLGPMSEAELKDLARKGAIRTDTPVSPDWSNWLDAGRALDATLRPPTPRAAKVPPPVPPPVNAKESILPLWIVGGFLVGGIGVLMCGGLLLVLAGTATDSGNRHTPVRSSADNRSGSRIPEVTRRTRTTSSQATLTLRCSDATNELLPIAEQLSREEQAALGLIAIATGMDIYGARVALTNVGDIPIRVYPQNLRVHFGNETAVVYTINDRRFLRPALLQPGQSTTGLVTYTARMDIGASMRLGAGGMSYDDPTVEVTYP